MWKRCCDLSKVYPFTKLAPLFLSKVELSSAQRWRGEGICPNTWVPSIGSTDSKIQKQFFFGNWRMLRLYPKDPYDLLFKSIVPVTFWWVEHSWKMAWKLTYQVVCHYIRHPVSFWSFWVQEIYSCWGKLQRFWMDTRSALVRHAAEVTSGWLLWKPFSLRSIVTSGFHGINQA